MNDKEFFTQFDAFSGDVIAKLRETLAVTIKHMNCSNSDMALAQIEILRQNANRRMKWDYDIDRILEPEEHVSKVHAAVLAIVDYALADAKEFALESDKSIFGSEEDDAREFQSHNTEQDPHQAQALDAGTETVAKSDKEPLKIRARRPSGGPDAWMKG